MLRVVGERGTTGGWSKGRRISKDFIEDAEDRELWECKISLR